MEIPAIDAVDPELSIVIPALNEELTITDFVAWCHEDEDAHAGEALIDGADLERSGRGCSLNCQVDRSAPSNQINENVERDAMNSLSP